jgi:hypothetical protein
VEPADDYQIEFRWKEEVVYWEGDQGFVLDGGWGVDPPVTYVPDPATWDSVVPGWLRGRQQQVVGRLRGRPNHRVIETPDYSSG